MAAISSGVSGRISILRRAPPVFQVAKPSGSLRAGLDPGADVAVLVVDGDDLLVVDPAADHLVGDPDAEPVPGLVLVLEEPVVSFSEASDPLRLDRPVTLPPQPPLTSVMNDLPTGNVAAAKKSSPSRRMAS